MRRDAGGVRWGARLKRLRQEGQFDGDWFTENVPGWDWMDVLVEPVLVLGLCLQQQFYLNKLPCLTLECHAISF